MRPLAGILPPIPTPFDTDGNILHIKLRENLSRWMSTDLHGVVVLGSNGEYVSLSESEKCAVWETARGAIPDDRLLIAGAGAESTAGAIALAREAARIGADAVLVATPHYYRAQMTSLVLGRHYRAVADASPIPVLLYNVPANTGIDMEAPLIIELAAHPNIAGIKDSGGNVAKMAHVLAQVPDDFAFFAGSGGFLFPALAVGAKGGVPAVANVAPNQSVGLYDAFRRGDYAQARTLQYRLARLNAAVTTRWSVPGLKAALDILGYYGGPPRPPLLPLAEGDRPALRELMDEALKPYDEPAGLSGRG